MGIESLIGGIKGRMADRKEKRRAELRRNDGIPEDLPRPTAISETDEEWEASDFSSEAARFQKAIQDIQSRFLGLENAWMEPNKDGKPVFKPSNAGPGRRIANELNSKDAPYLDSIIGMFEVKKFHAAEGGSKRRTIYENAVWIRDRIKKFIDTHPELID